jgi:hypothetical protein
MKDQYFGDVNDFHKYALLRWISRAASLRLGICWMLTEADGKTDGRHLDYLTRPEIFRAHDPELFDWLRNAVCEDRDRRTARLELSPLLSNAVFQSRLLTDSIRNREVYFEECRNMFLDCDLVFFDPDNGIERSIAAGRRGSSKYIYWNEITRMFETGASVLVYQHFPREERQSFSDRLLKELRLQTGAERVWTWATGRVLFLGAFHVTTMTPDVWKSIVASGKTLP